MELSAKLDQNITITIQTTQGNWSGASFLKTDKVAQVIQAVVSHFSFASNGKYELALEGKLLSPERTLVSYGVENGNTLVFTELGIAV